VRGTIGEYVSRPNKAWTQSGANPVAVSAELCTPSGAAASWTRDYCINLLCDASMAPDGQTQIRIACHHRGTSNWQVITSTLTAANPRQAFDLPADCDGVSLSSLDDAPLAVVPVFKRRA
jgi:hypothetical protein